jgi:hypothetical protein
MIDIDIWEGMSNGSHSGVGYMMYGFHALVVFSVKFSFLTLRRRDLYHFLSGILSYIS